jgi:hypothetical protein
MNTQILVGLLIMHAAFSQPVVSKQGTSAEGRLKTTITVTVRGLSEYLTSNKIANPKFILYLQGVPFQELAISGPTPGHDDLRFYLDRVPANRDQWDALLRSPVEIREIPLTVGLSTGVIFPTEMDNFKLRIYYRGVLYAGAVFFFALLLLFVWIARRSDVLRESGPPPPPPRVGAPPPRKAYSLGRVQMAVWFFVVATSFVVIWMITFGLDTISPNVLVLIGISTGTGLAAAVVDGSKAASIGSQRDQLLAEAGSLEATLAALAAKPGLLSPDDLQKQQEALNRRAAIAAQLADFSRQMATPVHESFLIDILSDANGISFHRFQMATWTLILVVIFAVSVWNDLLMPDFNTTLLSLMGISSGTYIGFKFPEVKN